MPQRLSLGIQADAEGCCTFNSISNNAHAAMVWGVLPVKKLAKIIKIIATVHKSERRNSKNGSKNTKYESRVGNCQAAQAKVTSTCVPCWMKSGDFSCKCHSSCWIKFLFFLARPYTNDFFLSLIGSRLTKIEINYKVHTFTVLQKGKKRRK